MRIIGGSARGIALASLGKGDIGAHLRPTADRVRESLFGMLEGGRFGDPINEATVLDLFAGTGALGLEALSRGASKATFVETGAKSLALLKQNIAKTRMDGRAAVLKTDARRPKGLVGPYSLVFLDPPYGQSLGEAALKTVLPYLATGALIVWEEERAMVAPPGSDLLEHRRYGNTEVTLLRVV